MKNCDLLIGKLIAIEIDRLTAFTVTLLPKPQEHEWKINRLLAQLDKLRQPVRKELALSFYGE